MPGTPPKPTTREALEKDWWDRWWAKDFSWEGLAEKKIAGTGGVHGEETLQDYWRRDPANSGVARNDDAMLAAGELVGDPNGRLWHLAHVPVAWRNGTAAKSAWIEQRTLLWDILTTRLEKSKATQFSEVILPIGGMDGRARFAGAIFLPGSYDLLPRNEALHLDAEWAWLDSLNANGRTFGPGARFDRAFFSGDTRFDQTNFAEGAGFQGAVFAGDTRFSEAGFAGLISFEDATFAGATFFYSTTFSRDAVLRRVTFHGEANFEHVVFKGLTHFRTASFCSDCRFHRARFQKDAHFKHARFQAHMNFGEAVFEEQAFFEDIVWPGSAGNWHKIFDRTMFTRVASFRGARRPGSEENERFIPHAAFDGTKFERTPDIDVTPEDAASKNFEASLHGAKFVALESKPANSQDALRRLTELERGCRVLKKAMADASDKTREQMFYRFELMARNARSDTPWPERCISRIYSAVSDYGTSVFQPLVCLILVWFSFALAYAALAHMANNGEMIPNNLAASFDLSVNRVFQPLTMLNQDAVKDNKVASILLSHPWMAFCTHVLCGLQSFISIILLFLSGLALRRRFQIN